MHLLNQGCEGGGWARQSPVRVRVKAKYRHHCSNWVRAPAEKLDYGIYYDSQPKSRAEFSLLLPTLLFVGHDGHPLWPRERLVPCLQSVPSPASKLYQAENPTQLNRDPAPTYQPIGVRRASSTVLPPESHWSGRSALLPRAASQPEVIPTRGDPFILTTSNTPKSQ